MSYVAVTRTQHASLRSAMTASQGARVQRPRIRKFTMQVAGHAARVAAGITHIVEVGISYDGIVFASRQDGPEHAAFTPSQ